MDGGDKAHAGMDSGFHRPDLLLLPDLVAQNDVRRQAAQGVQDALGLGVTVQAVAAGA